VDDSADESSAFSPEKKSCRRDEKGEPATGTATEIFWPWKINRRNPLLIVARPISSYSSFPGHVRNPLFERLMDTPTDATSALTRTPMPRPSDGSLIRAFRKGDQTAATALFERYANRVQALAGKRCNGSYSARFDAEDIVQSVFRALFHGIRKSAYEVPADGQLWGLLLVLTMNKIRSQMDHHRAAKRSVYRTQQEETQLRPVQDEDASAEFLRVVLDDIMTGLPESNRSIIQLRMEGYDVKEISERTSRSRRTVERVLNDFRSRIAE